jgi:hypothetical protein
VGYRTHEFGDSVFIERSSSLRADNGSPLHGDEESRDRAVA